jgi:hypothetical protein
MLVEKAEIMAKYTLIFFSCTSSHTIRIEENTLKPQTPAKSVAINPLWPAEML